MSDDEDYEYDYGGFLESDDDFNEDIVDHVDSLAEHTMHSPVLVNAHPDFEIDYDDWEYFTDEYLDGENEGTTKHDTGQQKDSKGQKKRKRMAEQDDGENGARKRMKVSSHGITGSRRPLVLWKNKSEEKKSTLPLIKHDDGNKIVLLKNWRELLKEPDLQSLNAAPEAMRATKKRVNGDPSPKLKIKKTKADVTKKNHPETRTELPTKREASSAVSGSVAQTRRTSKRLNK